jgi:hypothetical protein
VDGGENRSCAQQECRSENDPYCCPHKRLHL